MSDNRMISTSDGLFAISLNCIKTARVVGKGIQITCYETTQAMDYECTKSVATDFVAKVTKTSEEN